VVASAVANASNNTYTLTIPAATAGTYTVELYDTVLPSFDNQSQTVYYLNLTLHL
jgi:hypothetical protein